MILHHCSKLSWEAYSLQGEVMGFSALSGASEIAAILSCRKNRGVRWNKCFQFFDNKLKIYPGADALHQAGIMLNCEEFRRNQTQFQQFRNLFLNCPSFFATGLSHFGSDFSSHPTLTIALSFILSAFQICR